MQNLLHWSFSRRATCVFKHGSARRLPSWATEQLARLAGLGPYTHGASSASASANPVPELKIRSCLRGSADDCQIAQPTSSCHLDCGALAISASQLHMYYSLNSFKGGTIIEDYMAHMPYQRRHASYLTHHQALRCIGSLVPEPF